MGKKETNQSPIVIETNQYNKVLFEAQTNYQSLKKVTNMTPAEAQTSTNNLEWAINYKDFYQGRKCHFRSKKVNILN